MLQHKELAAGRWAGLPFVEQMANIGSEVHRASNWKVKGNVERSRNAFERALELIDLTIQYGRKGCSGRDSMLKEVCRLREFICEAYLSPDSASLSAFDGYFMHFGIAARTKSRPHP